MGVQIATDEAEHINQITASTAEKGMPNHRTRIHEVLHLGGEDVEEGADHSARIPDLVQEGEGEVDIHLTSNVVDGVVVVGEGSEEEVEGLVQHPLPLFHLELFGSRPDSGMDLDWNQL